MSCSRQRDSGHLAHEVMINERPAGAEDRAVAGHREGDLIAGTDRSAIGRSWSARVHNKARATAAA